MKLHWISSVLVFVLVWWVQELHAMDEQDATKVDTVFVVDKSGSIGKKNFELVKDFMEMFVEYLPIFPAKTRVAIVSFSTYVRLESDFNEHKNRECLKRGIERMRYTNGRTTTGNALEFVRTQLIFNARAGARENTRKVILVITDGRSNLGINPIIPAGRLKENSNISIFAVSITNKINETELEGIASSPSHVLHVKDFAALKNLTRQLQNELSKKCENDTTVLDECGRRCKCRNGRRIGCCRQRKEFTQLTEEERVRYTDTVMTASTDPRYKTKYDQLLTLHKELFNRRIHMREFFLTWHRWFILQYENLLQKIDCRVTVPYWDWTLVAANPFSSDFWNPGPGFGGNGSSPVNCVKSGPFREEVWSLIRSAGGGCLKRNFEGRFPDAITLASVFAANPDPKNFSKFETQLRIIFHNDVFCRIGGTMCSTDSAAAPEFVLHQAFIDKIWSDWQRKGIEHKFNAFFKNQEERMPATRYRSRDFLDLSNQPDCICAEYVEVENNVSAVIKGLTLSELRNIPRLPLPPLSGNATELFDTSSAELEEVGMFQASIEPRIALRLSSLKGTESINLGFRPNDVAKTES